MRPVLPLALVLALASGASAQRLPGPPGQEERLRALAAGLRCPVCQSENLLESRAPTAQEMLVLMQEQIAEGRSDAEIRAFFRSRYGDYVLLSPPAEGAGLVVWLLPGLFGVGAVAVLALRLSRRRRRGTASGPPLTEDRLRGMGP